MVRSLIRFDQFPEIAQCLSHRRSCGVVKRYRWLELRRDTHCNPTISSGKQEVKCSLLDRLTFVRDFCSISFARDPNSLRGTLNWVRAPGVLIENRRLGRDYQTL